MKKESVQVPTPSGILAMNPEKYRELNGVVLDLESYERHCVVAPTECSAPLAASTENSAPAEPSMPQPVFPCDPVHTGWYEKTSEDAIAYPIMGGVAYRPCNEGSGSYLTSFMTSYLLGSGSWMYGSGSSSGSGALCGGYGLELI